MSSFRPFAFGLTLGGACAATGFFFSNQSDRRPTKLLKFGVPDRGPELYIYDNHVLSYDRSRRTPNWVAQRISKENLSGQADRSFCKFEPDPRLPRQHSSQNEDFFRSGWSRGHMAPAGDYKNSQQAMNETFLLSNVVPQNFDNNEQYWNLLEHYCRGLAGRFENVYVISGPLYLPQVEPTNGERPKTYVKYQVIGKNQVAVPTHLFKVVIAESKKNEPLAAAFVIPNGNVEVEIPLREFQISLADLEILSGINFAPKLPKKEETEVQPQVKDLCTVDGCKLMEAREFWKMAMGRRMKNATKLHYLDKTWLMAADKGVANDTDLQKLYEMHKERIANEEKSVIVPKNP